MNSPTARAGRRNSIPWSYDISCRKNKAADMMLMRTVRVSVVCSMTPNNNLIML